MTQQLPPWVPIEAQKKPRRKPGPKPKVKPVEPKPKLHVRIELVGEVEFDLEGDQAGELKHLLKGIKLEDVLDFLDPWSSGVELRTHAEVTEGSTNTTWLADEDSETIQSIQPAPWVPEEWFKR